MSERRTIGQILMSFGRIDEADVERALEYQRDHGGYFGEALLGLGLVSQEELEWSLASQFDLPYVFPDADSIDPQAAGLVSPEWALAHLTLPIMRVDNTLTVIVDSPIKTKAVDELSKKTDCEIELALAGAGHIRELIRQVFARSTAREEVEQPTPVTLVEGLRLGLTAGAAQFGISTRGGRSIFWYDDAGTTRRRPLLPRWMEEMDELLTPPPSESVRGQERTTFICRLNRDGIVTPAEVHYLADESGHEYLIRPTEEKTELQERFTPPNPGVMSEVRMLCRSGAARFVVTTSPEELGHTLLPHLPALLLDANWRSIYINASEQDAADEAFSLRMPTDPEQWTAELETLRAFRFDVVTVDLTGNAESWAETALDVASVAFLLWPHGEDRRPAYEAGIRWELHISQADDGQLNWTLEPLRA